VTKTFIRSGSPQFHGPLFVYGVRKPWTVILNRYQLPVATSWPTPHERRLRETLIGNRMNSSPHFTHRNEPFFRVSASPSAAEYEPALSYTPCQDTFDLDDEIASGSTFEEIVGSS